jgi:zinc transporter 1/2/3
MSYANCFAAGVVVAALLLHMIPELFHDHSNHGSHTHSTHETHGDSHRHHHHHHENLSHAPAFLHSHTGQNKECSGHEYNFGPLFMGLSFLLLFAIDRLVGFGHSHDHDHSHDHEATNKMEVLKSSPVDLNYSVSQGHNPENSHGCCETVKKGDYAESCHSDDVIGGCHMDYLKKDTTRAQALIFILALSIHSFLEGLALGPLGKGGIISFSFGLIFHKVLESFALGVSIMRAQFKTSMNVTIITFYSILTPLGCALGILLKHLEDKPGPTIQILNGLAAGSFLFVSCIEMIPPEFHKKNCHSKYKFLALCLGFALIALINGLVPHEH